MACAESAQSPVPARTRLACWRVINERGLPTPASMVSIQFMVICQLAGVPN
jgi:hypothetical protein